MSRRDLAHAFARCRGGLTLVVLLALAGCQSTPRPPVTGALPLARAVDVATDDAVDQLTRQQPLLARLFDRGTSIYLAPVLQAGSREQTVTTLRVRTLIAAHLTRASHGRVLRPVIAAEAAALGELRLDTTLTAVTLPDGRRATDRMALALRVVNLQDGRELVHSQVMVADPDLDGTPVARHRDSPFTLPPVPAPEATIPDSGLTERERTVPIARLDEADAAYGAGRYGEALGLYRAAAALPGADTLQATIGRYLAAVRAGREGEARDAFSRIVAIGLTTRALGVKLLFTPGRTSYIDDPAISGPYAGWLREIARQASEAVVCLQVVGHSSHTGSEEYNRVLSGQRAEVVRTQLEAASPALAHRIATAGVGWRENLVGTGTDDLRDAVDRRVEFKVADCR
jgi:hypothetical protein